MKLLLLLLFPWCVRCQETLLTNVLSESGLCLMKYAKSNGIIVAHKGCGFFINGEYFATCYHFYDINAGEVRGDIWAFYNLRIVKGLLTFDSVSMHLESKVLPSKYNFSNHKYLRNDESTDFIVFKLDHKINSKTLIFCKSNCITDSLVSFGSITAPNRYPYSISVCNPVFSYTTKNIKQPYAFTAIFGVLDHGFSGSVVFNKRNQAIGMIQSGWDDIDNLLLKDTVISNALKQKQISEKQVNMIKSGYRKHLKLGSMISIDFLKKKYLYGYLK